MNYHKPTIFITISVGMIARNLLHNNFYELLRKKYHIVIFSPLWNDEDFIKEFARDDVEFKELKVADYLVKNIAIERKTIADFIRGRKYF